ncbi:MAG: DNA polymerase III subunit delta' [bacterium]
MFDEIVGQFDAVNILRKSIKSGRRASSYIFAGADGVGKKLAALAFSAALNCTGAKDANACGKCSSCRKLSGGNHPDIHVISPEKKAVSIAQIRMVQHDANLRPLEGAVKTYIIEDAHMMTTEAMNCLLKILEEPPSSVVFILLTSNPAGLLPTITSRCQSVRFSALKREQIRDFLVKGGFSSDDEASLISCFSNGSISMALAWRKRDLAGQRQNMVELIRASYARDTGALFAGAEMLSSEKQSVELFLDILASLYRDMILISLGEEEKKDDVFVNRDIIGDLKLCAKSDTVEGLREKVAAILETRALIQKNVNARLALEAMFLKLTKIGCNI